MLYLLEMFKKNGSLYDRVGTDSQPPRKRGYYETLGFFDTISVTALDSFEKLFEHTDEDLASDTPYNSYSLPMFSIENVTNDDILKEILECSASDQPQLKDNHIYQITILKLNPEIIEILNSEERESDISGMEFFSKIGNDILKDIEPRFAAPIHVTVLGGLGSFDFIVIFKINKTALMNADSATALFDSMNNIPFWLRRYRDEQTKKAYFDFSSSFIIFNQYNDFGKTGGPLCKVDIRLTMLHCRETENTLTDLLKEELKGFGIEAPRVHVHEALGDDDFHIHITAPLFSLLSLYTFDHILNIHETDLFREVHTAIIIQNPDIQYIQPAEKHFHVNVSFKLKKLKSLYDEIDHLIPYYLRNTVKHMIYTCKYLLCSDYYEMTGVQMYSLLVDLLTRLSASEWSTKAINECIQYFSYMVPSSMQMSSIYLENIDDIDWASPISKLIYAYEHFLVSLNDLLQPQTDVKRKLNLFLTIGHTPQIKSQRYLRPNQKDEKHYLLSFNLPSPSALNIAKTYGYLVHEVSHYCKMNVDRKNRNISFAKFLHKYLVNRICNVLKSDFGLVVENKDDMDAALLETIMNTLNDMGSSVACLPLYEFSHGLFSSFFIKLREDFYSNYTKYSFTDVLSASHAFKVVQKVAGSSNVYIDELARVIQESHADVFMLETCKFNWDELTEHYYSFFMEQSDTARKYEESNWIMRMVVIYCFYVLKPHTRLENDVLKCELQNGESISQEWLIACANQELEKIQNARDTMALEKIRFLNAIYKSVGALYPILEPVITNLLMSTLHFDINGKIEGKLDTIMFPDKSIMHSSIDVQLEFVLTHWMKEALWRLDILEQ